MRTRLHLALLCLPLAVAAQGTTAPTPPRPAAPVALSPFEFGDRYDAILSSLDRYRSLAPLAGTFDAIYADAYAPSAPLFAGQAFASSGLHDAIGFASLGDIERHPRANWAPDDPADSLYRVAREHLNRGDYRRAATLFGDISKRFPTSVYARDVPYWHAFSLYRLGGTPELQEALGILERWRAQAPASTSKGGSALVPRDAILSTTGTRVTTVNLGLRPDGDALAARIAGVLSSRGLANDAVVRRALTAGGSDACDQEEQSVRSEALSALMRSDPDAARTAATRMLTRKDDCSVPLRRTALFLLAQREEAGALGVATSVARNDPASTLRIQAIDLLAQMPNDDAVTVLEQLTRDPDASVQRVAARALARHPNPRARAAVRTFVERADTEESLRMAMIDGFTAERVSADDLAWLRGLYARTTSTRLQGRIAAAVARFGGESNTQWLTALARNDDEPLDSRLAAMRAIGATADMATLSQLYDGATHQRIRSALIDALSQRREPAAIDKLIEIARSGTDPGARRMAIAALSQSKDPRATKLLLDLVDK